MATVVPSSDATLLNGHAQQHWSLPNGDWTNDINSEGYAGVWVVASGVLIIEIPDIDGTNYREPPTGTAWWHQPTATLAGAIMEYVPARFRIRNASGGALTVTVYLIPRTSSSSGAVAAPVHS